MGEWQMMRPDGGGFANLRSGPPRSDTHREVADGVWVPKSYRATFRSPDRRLMVEIEGTVNQRGAPIVAALQVLSHEDRQRGVDRDALRAVPVAELLRRAVADHAWVRDGDSWTTHVGGEGTDEAQGRMRRQGRRLTRQHLEEVARIYQEHDGGAPTQAVALQLHLAPSTAAKHVMRAREAGLLPPTEPGRATNREGDQ